jgi:peptidyl-prolyl cis-trans isomerase D
VTRSTTASGDFSSAALTAAFNGPEGYVAVAPGGADDTTLVLTVTGVTTPSYSADAPGMSDVKRQLALQVSNDLLSQYIGEMQNDLGVTINQTALQSILAQPGG